MPICIPACAQLDSPSPTEGVLCVLLFAVYASLAGNASQRQGRVKGMPLDALGLASGGTAYR